MGEPGVPTMKEYLADIVPENGNVGFDGRVVAMGEGQDLRKALLLKIYQ